MFYPLFAIHLLILQQKKPHFFFVFIRKNHNMDFLTTEFGVHSITWNLIHRHSLKRNTKRQTVVHKTQHRKLETNQHKPHQNLGVISGDPPVAPVVLLMLVQTR